MLVRTNKTCAGEVNFPAGAELDLNVPTKTLEALVAAGAVVVIDPAHKEPKKASKADRKQGE